VIHYAARTQIGVQPPAAFEGDSDRLIIRRFHLFERGLQGKGLSPPEVCRNYCCFRAGVKPAPTRQMGFRIDTSLDGS